MHKDDLMTPKERKLAMSQGKAIDRMPINIMLSSLPARIAGFTYREGFKNAENTAKSIITTYERFGHDSLSLSYGLHGIGRALGSQLNSPEDTVPAIEKHLLSNLKEVHNLDIEKTRLNRDPHLKMRYDALEMINEAIGNEIGISFGITGPFTSATSLYSPENMLRSLRREAENVHKLLEFVTSCLLEMVDVFAPLDNVALSIADPVASGSLLSPKQYEEFVLPYTRRITERVHQHNKTVGYHICGDTSNILKIMASANPNSISLDNKVDLSFAREVLEDKVTFVGNVDPVNYMLLGNEESIDGAIKECYRKAYGAKKGFFISTGCDLPLDTPFENIEAYMRSCRKYAKYPVDTSLFME